MSFTTKLLAGDTFPELYAADAGGERRDLGVPFGEADWMMLVVYRGRHCPMCTRYLNAFEAMRDRLQAIGVDLAAISGDSPEQLADHRAKLDVSFPLYHSLGLAQMEALGLYVSHPRSPQETDHPFAEPGLFVINDERRVQVVDISNNPFVRPDPERLTAGLEWIRKPDNNYPIRGTYPR